SLAAAAGPRGLAQLEPALGLGLAVALAGAAAGVPIALAPVTLAVALRGRAGVELEGGLAVRVAVGRRAEALGVEGPRGLAALAGAALGVAVGLGLDAHGVLAVARGGAVRQQVEALAVVLDALGDLLERELDLGVVGHQLGAVATDGAEAALALLDVGPHADREDLEVGVLLLGERLLHLLLAHAGGAIGAVGEHHHGAELERTLVLVELLAQHGEPVDDGAV